MDALTTYEFYTTKYFGDTIDESLFGKWLSRATDKIMYLTNGRITEESFSEFNLEIQKAICALMDTMYNVDHAIANADSRSRENAKSITSGGESISFDTGNSLYMAVVTDRKAQERLYYDSIKDYLSGTGLLYWGC